MEVETGINFHFVCWGNCLRTVCCYYPRAGWGSINLFLILRKEVKTWGVINGTSKCSETEIVSDVEIKANQSNEQTTQRRSNKSEKLINFPSKANSLIISYDTVPINCCK